MKNMFSYIGFVNQKGSKDWILKLGWGQNKSAKYYKSDLSFKYMFNAKLFFLSNTMNPD